MTKFETLISGTGFGTDDVTQCIHRVLPIGVTVEHKD
jgi:hypothetical protein